MRLVTLCLLLLMSSISSAQSIEFGELKAPQQFEPLPFGPSFFIAGADRYSVIWIMQNVDFFRASDATGFILGNDNLTEEILSEIRKATGYSRLFIAPDLDELIEEYQLTVYPVFIDVKGGVVRQ